MKSSPRVTDSHSVRRASLSRTTANVPISKQSAPSSGRPDVTSRGMSNSNGCRQSFPCLPLSSSCQWKFHPLVTCQTIRLTRVIMSIETALGALIHHQYHPHQQHKHVPLKTVLYIALHIILIALPNSSHTLRVPYRYPHYPLFHKEILQGSSGRFCFVFFLYFSFHIWHKPPHNINPTTHDLHNKP